MQIIKELSIDYFLGVAVGLLVGAMAERWRLRAYLRMEYKKFRTKHKRRLPRF